MLVRCNQECKLGIGTTIVKLDIDTGQTICMECGEEVRDISNYCKQNMKNNGDILNTKKNRAFTFPCLKCENNVETIFLEGKILGVGCDDGECSFNIPRPMMEALKQRVSFDGDNNEQG